MSASSGEQVLPIAELCFDNMPEGSWPILTYAAKWDVGSPEDLGSVPVCPADLTAELPEADRRRGSRRPGRVSAAPRATAGWTSGSTPPGSRLCWR